MNIQQQALNLIKENGGTATRKQIGQLIEFTKPNTNPYYLSTLCWRLETRKLIKYVERNPSNGENDVLKITTLGAKYIKNNRVLDTSSYAVKPKKRVRAKAVKAAPEVAKVSTPAPVEKLIRGSIIRDLLFRKFDQLSASERCGLLEIYNIIESNSKTNSND